MRTPNGLGHVEKSFRYHSHIVEHKMRETGHSVPDLVEARGAAVDGGRMGIATCCLQRSYVEGMLDHRTLNSVIPCNGVVVDS